MIESPVLRQLVAEARQADILRVLTRRFQSVPSDVAAALRDVTKEKKLDQLIDYAAECPTMEAFREKLLSS